MVSACSNNHTLMSNANETFKPWLGVEYIIKKVSLRVYCNNIKDKNSNKNQRWALNNGKESQIEEN